MKVAQQPHRKMSEQEIKDTINELYRLMTVVHEGRLRSTCRVYEGMEETLYEIDEHHRNLKKHFCPEKFVVMVPSDDEKLEVNEEFAQAKSFEDFVHVKLPHIQPKPAPQSGKIVSLHGVAFTK